MPLFARVALLLLTSVLLLPALQAAATSRQQADSFSKKLTAIGQRGEQPARPGSAARRTPVTETEVNSWFEFKSQPLLPTGLTQPQLTIIGNGKVTGGATVDLGEIGKRRSSGGALDLWSYLGGRVPLTVTGVLHTKDGRGRFELERAELSGIPVPKPLLQEIVSYYSRTDDHPQGVRLDDPFELPAGIQQIEVGQGQAVVVQ
jgi:hypothetical protein